MVLTIDRHLAAVARHGLPGRTADPAIDAPTGAAWQTLLERVTGQRLTSCLDRSVRDGVVRASAAQATEVVERHVAALGHDLRIEQLLLRAGAVLEAAGIPVRVLKGSAYAHLLYDDPAQRTFTDVDLLVPAARFADAVAALATVGIGRRVPELHPGFDRRFGKGATLASADGLEVDLHRTLAAGPFAMTIDADALFTTGEPFELGGTVLHGLGREERFLHACVHAVLGDDPPRLVPLRDVAMTALDPLLDTGRALELATAWQLRAVVQRALALTWSALDLSKEHELTTWAAGYTPLQWETRAMAAYAGGEGRWAREALAALPAIPRRRDQLAYLRALALPDRRALVARRRSYVTFWRRGLRALRRS